MGRAQTSVEKQARIKSLASQRIHLTLKAAREDVADMLKANPAYAPRVKKWTEALIMKGSKAFKIKRIKAGSYQEVMHGLGLLAEGPRVDRGLQQLKGGWIL